MKWSYGVQTCPSRRDDLLPRTLASLAAAGFGKPRLFVDGCNETKDWEQRFNLPVTTRYPAVRVAGSWMLALGELYIRQPDAQRFAVFQDDFVTCRNLRQYLEQSKYPVKGYQNLYSFPKNEALAPKDGNGRKDIGWHLSDQLGKGAVALVFDRDAVVALLSSVHFIGRPQDLRRGWRAIDGGIVTAMKNAGYREFVHYPSLTQHTGLISTIKEPARRKWADNKNVISATFPGEEADALELLEKSCV